MTALAVRTPSGNRGGGAAGFTYVGLIILVAIIALVAATTLRVGVTLQRAQAERDLLQIGEQFSNALKSYAAATPAGQPQQPPTLQELLKDPRFPGTRRHLRKIFVDPVTGRAEWGIIFLGDNKGVLGIHSLSTAPPIKIANFPQRFMAFDGRQKISDWVFTFDGQAPLPPALLKPGQPGQAAAVPPAAPPNPPRVVVPPKPAAPQPDAVEPTDQEPAPAPAVPAPAEPSPAQPGEPEGEPAGT